MQVECIINKNPRVILRCWQRKHNYIDTYMHTYLHTLHKYKLKCL